MGTTLGDRAATFFAMRSVYIDTDNDCGGALNCMLRMLMTACSGMQITSGHALNKSVGSLGIDSSFYCFADYILE